MKKAIVVDPLDYVKFVRNMGQIMNIKPEDSKVLCGSVAIFLGMGDEVREILEDLSFVEQPNLI